MKAYNLFFLFLSFNLFGQIKVIKSFSVDSIYCFESSETIHFPKSDTTISKAILIALSYYPELNNSKIKFKFKKQLAPLSARPTIWSAFQKAKKRTYLINISTKTTDKFTPIILQNLSFNSKIGVLGHELAHISEYKAKSGWFFIGLFFKHLSPNSIDRFEFNTDNRCIDHLLGFQLLSWSQEVRSKLDIRQWGGAENPTKTDERYMNPSTILEKMSKNENYVGF